MDKLNTRVIKIILNIVLMSLNFKDDLISEIILSLSGLKATKEITVTLTAFIFALIRFYCLQKKSPSDKKLWTEY